MNTAPRRHWLPFLNKEVPADCATPTETAAFELKTGCESLRLRMPELELRSELGEGWRISGGTISGGETGLLYGVYAYLMAAAAGKPIAEAESRPRYALRMINCWDNMDGSVERGYSGRSLWFRDGRFSYDPVRLRQVARMLASVGLNVLCINNVNVHEPAQGLIDEFLPDTARLAALLRPFGVRLMLSVDFSQPMRHGGLPTADPLNKEVQRWWRDTADRVYAAIPDFAGLLVKADSEHRPGPFTYGRNHAEGANLLARALKPHGGVLVWRAFVYNCQQDWRDTKTDRPMAAYETYHPLDGQFDGNVILQVKNGPFDFQVREPISPTLLAMPRTNLAMELQLAQEYTGQQTDIYAMNPMWKELMEELREGGDPQLCAMAAVSNLGDESCVTGHPFAAVNLFGFGRFAWDPAAEPERVIADWVRLTYGFEGETQAALTALLMNSRAVYEKYTAPLGLNWMVTPNSHYGPNPSGYEYQSWGTYHRATREAVGIDRTDSGTGYLSQYPAALREKYGSADTCPDSLLLFFHRRRYGWVMPDGRTLIQRIYDDHFEGYAEAEKMAETLAALPLPEPDRSEALRKMALQLHNAREWRDVINSFFARLSGCADAQGRDLCADFDD